MRIQHVTPYGSVTYQKIIPASTLFFMIFIKLTFDFRVCLCKGGLAVPGEMQLLHKFHNTASKSTEYFSIAASQEQGAESKDMLVKLTSNSKLTVGVNVRINACLPLCVSPVLVCVRCTTISHWTGK